MNEYFNSLNQLPNSRIIKEMRKYAEKNKVPIINDEGLTLMLQLVELINPKRFLEIGSAIGFCAINIASINSDVLIDTIEKNEEMYDQAARNIFSAKLDNRINLIYGDALDWDISAIDYKYDMIFIDAAKAQYIKFFEKYQSYLAEDGIIVTDNLLFHGLVNQTKSIENKNLKNLVRKIEDFNYWLSKNKQYQTRFLAIGDGIAISRKVK